MLLEKNFVIKLNDLAKEMEDSGAEHKSPIVLIGKKRKTSSSAPFSPLPISGGMLRSLEDNEQKNQI